MKTILSLVLFLVIGLVASRGMFRRARARLPVTVVLLTGIEFLFLGVLLGPHFLNLITPAVLEDLTPVAYLALGWAGLLFGTQLSRRHLFRLNRSVFAFLAFEGVALVSLGAIALLLVVGGLFPERAGTETLSAVMVLAIALAVSSPTIVTVLARMLPSRGHFTRVMRILTSLSPVIPLLGFGLLFTMVHPRLLGATGFLSGLMWWLFANAVGVVMGFVFALLVKQRLTRDERLLVVMGIALFVGGMCYFLQLSALYTSMIMGVVMGNFSRRRVQVFEQLLAMEKTIYIAFLILIGAMVSITQLRVLLLVVVYVALRLLLKAAVSGFLARRIFPEFGPSGMQTGLALSAQGGIALAVALDYGLGTTGLFVSEVTAVIAAAVVLNEIIGVVLTRRALAASGDIRTRRRGKDGRAEVQA